MSKIKSPKKLKSFWKNIANLILDNKVAWIAVIVCSTAFMVYNATQLELSYELAKILPRTDKNSQIYEQFKERYGEDGNVMVIAFESDNIYDLPIYQKW